MWSWLPVLDRIEGERRLFFSHCSFKLKTFRLESAAIIVGTAPAILCLGKGKQS